MRTINVSSALEAVGLICLLLASFAWDWRAGVAVLGCLFVLVGYFTGGEAEVSE